MNKIKINELDIEKVGFSMKLDKEKKRKIFFVNHNNKPILLQTPKVYLPNGIKHWVSSTYPESFELELSFGQEKNNENPLIEEFHTKMQQLDEKIKNEILNNPKDWIGKQKVSMEMIETAFYPNPIVKVSKDKEGNELGYPDRMRLKIDREMINGKYTGRFVSNRTKKTEMLIFDQNNNKMEFNENNCEHVIPRGSKGILIIELVNINIVGDKVYPKWRLLQAKVFSNSNAITSNIIDDLEDDLDSENVEEVEQIEQVEEVEEHQVEEENQEDFIPVKKTTRNKRGVSAI